MRSITIFLLAGILGFTLLNPNCNCDEITMQSPVYPTDKISVFQQLKQGIGRVVSKQQKKPVTGLKTMPNSKEMECLRNNIYFESRGEHEEGQRAVSHVTINRMNDNKYPDTLCGVTHQKKQFSWTHDRYSNIPPKGEVLDKSMRIAKSTWYHNQLNLDNTNGALYFNQSHRSGLKIGRHYFY